MNLLDKLPKLPFLSNNSQPGQYYFALNIFRHKVEAAVWGIEGKRLTIINSASSPYSSEDDLAEAANYCLDIALADFPIEPTKILYGVPEGWLQDENLKPEYLKILRKLSKDLDVTPMAFVSSPHAIAHLLQKQQGVPLTAVVVELADPLTVSVVKAGKVLGSKVHRRSENLPQDIERCLMTFTEVEVLPSRIIIYGDPQGARFKDELQSFPWMNQLPFLHLPKIEELPEGTSLQAICLAGGSELEPEIVFHSQKSPHQAVSRQPLSKPLPVNMEDHPESNIVAHHRNQPLEDEMVDDEIVGGPPSRRGDQQYQGVAATQSASPLARVKQLALAPFGFFRSAGVHTGKTSRAGFPKKMLAIPVVVLVLLIVGGVFLPKAQVDVFIDMQNLERDATVTADPNVSSVDESSKKIPGKIVETNVDGSAKGTASGKKKVGDPAKGAVVVYNKTDSSKTFPAGTVLTGPGNLKFKLDTSVEIASQSGVRGGVSFGKSNGSATAVEIGPEGNLAAGKELAIDGQSADNFSAEVDTAFSGGVSKDVTVVTADDQKKLLATLTADLRSKAQQQLQAELTGDTKILPEALTEQVTKQSYSKAVGDQAQEFTLTASAKYKGTSYSDGDLKQIVSKLVETNVPTGFELDLSKTETQANVSKVEKDGTLVFTAKFKAKLTPKINPEQLKKELAFRTRDQAEAKLREVDNVIGSNIVLTPNIPIKPLQRLPLLPQNITLAITAK